MSTTGYRLIRQKRRDQDNFIAPANVTSSAPIPEVKIGNGFVFFFALHKNPTHFRSTEIGGADVSRSINRSSGTAEPQNLHRVLLKNLLFLRSFGKFHFHRGRRNGRTGRDGGVGNGGGGVDGKLGHIIKRRAFSFSAEDPVM